MTNDCKLGLVLGVGLVMVVAVVFFRKELLPDKQAETEAAAGPVPGAREAYRTVKSKASTRTVNARKDAHHTVKEGETLFSLAQHYYGDGDKFVDIFRANRDHLSSPDALTPGTILLIPELPRPEGE